MTAKPTAILVTGASGGFGLAFARQLEGRCDRLILTGRDEARLRAHREQLYRPDAHRIVVADLASQQGIDAVLQSVEGCTLKGLVNNAGFGLWGAFTAYSAADHAVLIATDLLAPMRLTHHLLPALKHCRGFVINVSSLAGESPLSWMGSYSAAKAGLTYWSEALRIEQEGRVRVVTLAPGPSPTGFRAVSGMPEMLGGGLRTPPEAVVAAAIATLDRGGGFCVPGWRHRMLWLLQKLSPRELSVRIMHRYLRAR